MSKLLDFIHKEYERTIGIGDFQLPMFLDAPVHIGENLVKTLDNQCKTIDDFFKVVSSLGRTALIKNDVELEKILFSEPVTGMTKEYHKALPDFCWDRPILYRTDQSVSGKIYEIQAPGSGWGDIPLLTKAYRYLGHTFPDCYCNFAEAYTENIKIATGREVPKVYHMNDASSAPAGMRYFFAITSDKLKYWGIHNGVIMDKVDYVTAHSAAALTTSNYFNKYMEQAQKGNLVFGIAPNLIYDQKAIYLLPFYRLTRDMFSDEMRKLFPFTTIIENDGFYDNNDQFISLKEFSKKHKNERLYYLKYGGPELCKNWGSRAVFRLNGSDCEKRLSEVNELSKKGEIWLLQEDVSKENMQEASDEIKAISEYVKLSAFNGINGQLGIRIMVRQHFKVHGQSDTKVGIAIS